MIRTALLSLLLVLSALPAFADGTVAFDPDVKKLLDQRPFFAKTLYETFDFAPQAIATRIGNEASPKLGGARIGPYRIEVKKKGAAGDFDRQIFINTAVSFLDAKGKETDDMKRAVSIKEEFISIEFAPLNELPKN